MNTRTIDSPFTLHPVQSSTPTSIPIAPKPIRATLCKDERLSRKKIIDELHEKGQSIKTPAIILIYHLCELPCDFPAQVMVTVGKRNFKRAHDRNRIKRLMREAYRKQKSIVYTSLQEKEKQAALLFIFTGRSLPNAQYAFGKISELLKRFTTEIGQLKEEATTNE